MIDKTRWQIHPGHDGEFPSMHFAYADPPYIGCANRYPEKAEVDHAELIAELRWFDGWALSASSPSLARILPLCPEGTRIAAWIKPFCAFKPNVNPAYAWEPVLFWPGRARSRKEKTVRDWVSANITMKKGVVGAKPIEFCWWLFDLLGMLPDDHFFDLYPGTGIVGQCWETWKQQRTWMVAP
jgi:hypothetical protein